MILSYDLAVKLELEAEEPPSLEDVSGYSMDISGKTVFVVREEQGFKTDIMILISKSLGKN